MTVRTGDALLAAWSAFGGDAGQDHPSGAGIIESNEYLIVASFSRHCHPAPGHPLRDLPAHRGLPARHPQRSTDRALPPGPSRSARPARPVRSAACRVRAALSIDFSSRVGADRLGGGSRAFPRSWAVSISFSPRTSVAGRRRAVVARTAVFRVCGGLCRAVTGVRLAVLVRGPCRSGWCRGSSGRNRRRTPRGGGDCAMSGSGQSFLDGADAGGGGEGAGLVGLQPCGCCGAVRAGGLGPAE